MVSFKKRLLKFFTILISLVVIAIVILNIQLVNSLVLNLVDYIWSLESFSPLIFLVLILVVIVGSWVGFSFAIVLISASLPINIFYAFILAYIVSIVSAFLEFIIVRKIARRYVEENFTSKIKKIEDYNQIFNAKGFILIFMIRLVMLIPFELVNLFGALSRVKFKDYILGTMIGIIPSIIITIYFLRNAESVWSPNFIISLIVLIIFVSIPLLSKKVRKIVFK